LVVAAQEGDRAAMGELFTRYRSHVMAVAMRRLHDENEAQELCQEVFLQVLRKLTQLRQPECFAGWLTSITRRMAINRAVRRPPSVATEPQLLEVTCVDHRTPLCAAVDEERAASVQDGLRRLRALDRATLEAFYVRGQSLLEMSDHFQAPLGTIKRRLHVARRRLAKEMEEQVTV
jgi:RNA polymerase sigma-70 factor (ECF subfamily)